MSAWYVCDFLDVIKPNLLSSFFFVPNLTNTICYVHVTLFALPTLESVLALIHP